MARQHNHLAVVFDCFNAEVLDHIRADSLKIQALIAGKGNEQRIGLCTVVAFRNVTAVVNLSVLCRMKNIIVDKSALCFGADGYLSRYGGSYSKFSPFIHSVTDAFALSDPASEPAIAKPSKTLAFGSRS